MFQQFYGYDSSFIALGVGKCYCSMCVYLAASLVTGMIDAFYWVIASLDFPWLVFLLLGFSLCLIWKPNKTQGKQRKPKETKGTPQNPLSPNQKKTKETKGNQRKREEKRDNLTRTVFTVFRELHQLQGCTNLWSQQMSKNNPPTIESFWPIPWWKCGVSHQHLLKETHLYW